MTESSALEPVTFMSLVLSLATTAAVHFGDLGDPATGERSPQNLEGARQMIEMLGMLQDKTKGNLTPQEATILERVLFELRMRFVEAERAAGPAGGSKIIVP
jgi:hypothetical protein